MKREILLIMIMFNGCVYIDNQKNSNIPKLDYSKYKSSFFYTKSYKNKTVKYFEGSYRENQSSSFEPMIPVGELTREYAKKVNNYYRVIYDNNNIAEASSIDNDKITTKVYYDEKGRKIKKYWYRDDSFEIISFNGEESLYYIYCNGETKKCTKRHYTRKEDEARYGEPMPVFTFTP